MKSMTDTSTVVEQLERCQQAGMIDRFIIREGVVVLVQGRYAHRIPLQDVSTFLSGMMLYARAAGVERVRNAA